MPPPKRKAAARDRFSPSRVLKPNSLISSNKIHDFLLNCMSDWEVLYNDEEKRQIIETLPAKYRAVEPNARGKLNFPLTTKHVREDPFFKKGVERLGSDIDDGFYEAPWQNRAEKASKKRREGGFDGYIQTNIEEKFGADPTQSSAHQAGEVTGQQKKDHMERRSRNRTSRMDLENSKSDVSPTRLSQEWNIVAHVWNEG